MADEEDGLPNPFLAQLKVAAAKKAAKAAQATQSLDAQRAAKDAEANAAAAGGGAAAAPAAAPVAPPPPVPPPAPVAAHPPPAPAPAPQQQQQHQEYNGEYTWGDPNATSYTPQAPQMPASMVASPPNSGNFSSGNSIMTPVPSRIPTMTEPLMYTPGAERQLREIAEDGNNENKPIIVTTVNMWLQQGDVAYRIVQTEDFFFAIAAVATNVDHAQSGCELMSRVIENPSLQSVILSSGTAYGAVSNLIASSIPIALETGTRLMAELCEQDLYIDRNAAAVAATVSAPIQSVAPQTMQIGGIDPQQVQLNFQPQQQQQHYQQQQQTQQQSYHQPSQSYYPQQQQNNNMGSAANLYPPAQPSPPQIAQVQQQQTNQIQQPQQQANHSQVPSPPLPAQQAVSGKSAADSSTAKTTKCKCAVM